MNQNEINEKEWNDPENWSGGILGFYFSKKDTRTWVPKPDEQGFGWTVNTAKPAGPRWIFFLLQLPFLITVIAIILMNQ